MSDPISSALCDRIAACVPVAGHAYTALLALLDVEASDAVPTACVTTGARSRMLVNPAFVARHCRTDDHLAMLVLHELHHVLLGHTRIYRRVTPAQNWAFDCLINAQLCRLFPHPKHVTFFTQFVRGDGGAGDLLAPPRDWHPRLSPGALNDLRRRDAAARPRWGDLHWRLYSEDSVTTEELYRLLERVAAAEGVPGDLVLLGDHASSGESDDVLNPDALREVREIVARWPMVVRRGGRDQGGESRDATVTLAERRRDAVARLRRALARLSGAAPECTAPAVRTAPVASTCLLPWNTGGDRRAVVLAALGHAPLLYAGQLAHTHRVPAGRTHVYLDVSGSMDGVMAPLYAALAGCLDQVEPDVHLFSTKVATVGHAQLRAGVRVTTDGTDIETVTAHLLASGARRALVVTDGWVGRIPDDHWRRLRARGVRLAAAVTEPGDPGFALERGIPVVRLPPLDAAPSCTPEFALEAPPGAGGGRFAPAPLRRTARGSRASRAESSIDPFTR